jgi:hypothetical protein
MTREPIIAPSISQNSGQKEMAKATKQTKPAQINQTIVIVPTSYKVLPICKTRKKSGNKLIPALFPCLAQTRLFTLLASNI